MKHISSLLAFVLGAGALHAKIPNSATADRVLGQPNYTTASAVTPGTPLKFNNPSGVAIDPLTGKLFVSDSNNNRILRYRNALSVQIGELPEIVIGQSNFSGQQPNQGGTPGPGTLARPGAIFVDTKGRLWIAEEDNNRVVMFENASQIGTGAPADRVFGQALFTTQTQGTTAAEMKKPGGVWVDASDRLWVSEYGNNRVTRFDNVTSKMNGSAANGVIGQNAFGTTSGLLGPSFLSGPLGICVDAKGTLWVADGSNARVVGFENAATLGNSYPPATRVFGQPDFNTATLGTTASQYRRPCGVFPDGQGNLWILDQSFCRAVRVAINQPNSSAATGVIGQPDFTSLGNGVTARLFNNPFGGFAVDAGGHLWVTDSGNSRVLRFSQSAVTIAASAPTVRVAGSRRLETMKLRLKIRGTASGAVRIEVKSGKGGYRKAKGTAKWSFAVPLKPGRNVVLVRAVGAGQLVSSTVRLKIVKK